MALKYRYPKNLEYKLHQRRGQCLTQLGQHIEARNAFNQAMTALDFVPKLSPEKKESIIRDIHALVAEIGMGLRQELSIYYNYLLICFIFFCQNKAFNVKLRSNLFNRYILNLTNAKFLFDLM